MSGIWKFLLKVSFNLVHGLVKMNMKSRVSPPKKVEFEITAYLVYFLKPDNVVEKQFYAIDLKFLTLNALMVQGKLNFLCNGDTFILPRTGSTFARTVELER